MSRAGGAARGTAFAERPAADLPLIGSDRSSVRDALTAGHGLAVSDKGAYDSDRFRTAAAGSKLSILMELQNSGLASAMMAIWSPGYSPITILFRRRLCHAARSAMPTDGGGASCKGALRGPRTDRRSLIPVRIELLARYDDQAATC